MAIFLKRAYDPPTASDGKRILVDRLWPRGLAKVKAKFDVWLKDVAPSTELREWFGHDPAKWTEFQTRYRAELKGNPAFDELKKLAHQGNITLIYAARDRGTTRRWCCSSCWSTATEQAGARRGV